MLDKLWSVKSQNLLSKNISAYKTKLSLSRISSFKVFTGYLQL